ncbi:MAG: glucokinase [Hyphomicrobiales bacterium]|nr:glucokinase [Hyphomicrobiales bacterium]
MSEFIIPFPVLVSDIGGTNVRFAIQSTPDAPLGPVVHRKTGEFPGLVEAAEAALDELGERPRSLIACGAGPVDGRKLKLTNAPWVIDGPEVARRLGLAQGLLFNDFEAQALSLPAIPREWARAIGPASFGPPGPQVILGPGTGLGIGALVEAAGRHTPLASEACHIDFGPLGDEEAAFWPHLERAHGRVTTESVLSGVGLTRVHAARVIAQGKPNPGLDAPALVAAAQADPAGEEAASVRMFWRIIARFAGDMGIAFVATGGVTLAGGVLPRIVDFLDDAVFRQAFEGKAPVDGLARRIPTRLVMRADSVLVGMAAIAATPQRYAIDTKTRGWV